MDPHLPWLLLLNPLVAAAVIHLLLRRWPGYAALLAVASACLGFLTAIGIWFSGGLAVGIEVPWIDFGEALRIPIGFIIDPLSKVMLLVVTGIGALIHIYSVVYMKGDDAEPRYFGNLTFFMFSMLGIVLANNFAMMFIFWELVGVSSYLLIGHWFTRDAAAAAANKAFIVNRIGDFGFILGILMIWSATGTLIFPDIAIRLATLNLQPAFLTAAALLVFCGAVGKSAQVPLHVWLPDAMEGPTPVSALIHAATMVAAGVYMLARVFFLIGTSPAALNVIAFIGIATAVLAALMATQQDDIKRILAYSTLSQLGYMISAVGLSAPGAAMFHLFTHAFFKALLFLAAGAIIYRLHHEQDIWRMGGLRHRMPLTFLTFTAGYLALIGCPFFSGFFSKDAILLAAWHANKFIFVLGWLTAFLTAFYMTRLFVVAFLGEARTEEARHGHDGPPLMTVPLLILALLAVGAGWGTFGYFEKAVARHDAIHLEHSIIVPILAVLAFAGGGLSAFVLYQRKANDPVLIPAFRNKFYIDELYAVLVAGTQDLMGRFAGWFDKWILDGVFVRGLSGASWGLGFCLRFFQFGNLQGYAFLFGAGVVALIYFMVLAK
jgi:NADH-quinone oxidoreductase subunit L